MDNRQLFGAEKHVNQLYLSSGRIYKMGEHGPSDASTVETGKCFNFIFRNNFSFFLLSFKYGELLLVSFGTNLMT